MAGSSGTAAATGPALRGFSPSAVARELELERRFAAAGSGVAWRMARGRPWLRHTIYAPGLYTGYRVKTPPAVREAIEQQPWAEAEEYAAVSAAALGAYCDEIDRATALLQPQQDRLCKG